MKKKQLIISILILVVIALAVSFWFWQKNTQKPAEEVVVGQEQKTDEIDISDWQTFEDKELGISYRYPGDCGRPNGAGPGTGASLEIICKGLFMMYEPLNYSYVLSDYSKSSHISALEEKQTITFITNGQRKMLIRILTDDLFSNTVLSTFKFID